MLSICWRAELFVGSSCKVVRNSAIAWFGFFERPGLFPDINGPAQSRADNERSPQIPLAFPPFSRLPSFHESAPFFIFAKFSQNHFMSSTSGKAGGL